MKLLTVGSLPPELGGPVRGGVATFHATLLEGLRQSREVEIAGVFPPTPLDRELDLPVFTRPDDVSLAHFYMELLDHVRPDVVLMNHIANTVGVTHAQLDSPPPAIGVVHSWHNIAFASPDEVAGRRAVNEEAMSGLAALVVGSRHCLAEGQRLGFTYPAIAEAIHYPLQPLYLDPAMSVCAGERHGALFLGSLIERKNPAAAVEAAALLPGLDLVLAGEGELEEQLRASIADLGLDRRVRIAGHFPRAEHLVQIRDMLLGVKVMCLPSSSESFGLAYTEALACGTPVIGFGPTVREIRDAVGIEIGVALDDPTPDAIATAIGSVLEREWDRKALREATLEKFGAAIITERYVELLSSVTAPARAS